MHRVDNSKFLLYIEPPSAEKLLEPVVDDITTTMSYAIRHAIPGNANYSKIEEEARFSTNGGWMGHHTTECGRRSTGNDYLLENGMITNSLADFYLEWYRNSIPESEMRKVRELVDYYKTKDAQK